MKSVNYFNALLQFGIMLARQDGEISAEEIARLKSIVTQKTQMSREFFDISFKYSTENLLQDQLELSALSYAARLQEEEKQELMKDLRSIAISDGTVDREESAFLVRVKDALKVMS